MQAPLGLSGESMRLSAAEMVPFWYPLGARLARLVRPRLGEFPVFLDTSPRGERLGLLRGDLRGLFTTKFTFTLVGAFSSPAEELDWGRANTLLNFDTLGTEVTEEVCRVCRARIFILRASFSALSSSTATSWQAFILCSSSSTSCISFSSSSAITRICLLRSFLTDFVTSFDALASWVDNCDCRSWIWSSRCILRSAISSATSARISASRSSWFELMCILLSLRAATSTRRRFTSVVSAWSWSWVSSAFRLLPLSTSTFTSTFLDGPLLIFFSTGMVVVLLLTLLLLLVAFEATVPAEEELSMRRFFWAAAATAAFDAVEAEEMWFAAVRPTSAISLIFDAILALLRMVKVSS
mmetsp:Transcript_31784/g.70026  ORF Transcript_31784/g.70026 Transcript_31784/m.70026 type:complete len:354 (-) Transcript_31784:258-1319(-)